MASTKRGPTPTVFPLQSFEHVGDILAVPQLTEQSPFLNSESDAVQQQNGISDEMYEWLPQQTMSLLRVRGFAALCDLLLRPGAQARAEWHLLDRQRSSAFGMVTNYQVVAEIATRAVVRFNSTLTNVVTLTTYQQWLQYYHQLVQSFQW